MNDWEYTWDAIRIGTVTGPESAEKLERFIAEVERAAEERGYERGLADGWDEGAFEGEYITNPYRKETP